MADDPFEGKTFEEVLALVHKDWDAIAHRADYIISRMVKSEFLANPGGFMNDDQLKVMALFVAGVAALHRSGQTLPGVLPMLGQLWGIFDKGNSDLKSAKFDPPIRMSEQKGVH